MSVALKTLSLAAVMITCIPISLAQSAGGAGPAGATQNLPDNQAPSSEPLVTRFYDITPLVTSRRHYSYRDSFDGEGHAFSGKGRGSVSASGGGFGGGSGGFGGGSGGGAGLFSVPVAASQMGGSSIGNMGVGAGGNYAGGYGATESSAGIGGENWYELSLKDQLENQGDSLQELIMENVATESWEDYGDGRGRLTDLGSTLLIKQTESVHVKIAEFLKELTTAVVGKGTYKLQAWWVPVNATDTSEIQQILDLKAEPAIISEQLNSMTQTAGGYQATLLCRDHVTTHTASGRQVPVVVGSIPVVGTGESGDSPTVRTLLLGIVLEAQVSSVPSYSVESRDGQPLQQVELAFRSTISNPDTKVQELIAAGGKIDRYSLGRHVAAGSCVLEVGKPTAIAALTRLSTSASDTTEKVQMHLIVRVTHMP